jgi:hypothetical protein
MEKSTMIFMGICVGVIFTLVGIGALFYLKVEGDVYKGLSMGVTSMLGVSLLLLIKKYNLKSYLDEKFKVQQSDETFDK